MVAPPDYSKLKKEERLQTREMSEEEKLRLQLQIAEKNAEAEQAGISRLELMRQAAAGAAAAATPPVNPDQSGAVVASTQQKTEALASSQPSRVAAEQVKVIIDLAREVFASNPDGFVSLLSEFGAERTSELSAEDAMEVLKRMFAIRDGATTQEAPFDTPAAGTSPAAQQDSSATQGGIERMTTEQADKCPAADVIKQMIKSTYVECFGDAARFSQWMQARGLYAIDDLTAEQASSVLADMQAMLEANHGTSIRPSQTARLKDLIYNRLKLNEDEQEALLRPFGVSTARSLTSEQADSIISDLLARELGLKN
jgi:hypothetical protein